MTWPDTCDVAVLGGGNAALSAALTAARAGRRVVFV
jgi:succinate dehydrogenase/fumarate reductase flavoprotein subunit